MSSGHSFARTLLLGLLTVLLFSNNLVSAAVEPITTKGSKFFYPNGTQFFIKGVVYSSSLRPEVDSYTGTQGAEVDVLADITACSRDASYLSSLGVNTVSTLYLDWSRSHDLCFSAFANNDIYILPLLESGSTAINGSRPSWNVTIYDIYKMAIDEASKHDNILGMYIGYENVVTTRNNSYTFSAIKAVVRDMKAYMQSKDYRNIPLGYASDQTTNDDFTLALIDYLTCGGPEQSVDFLGFGSYSWCGNSTYTQSGYRDDASLYRNSSVPVFFSEFGCNNIQPRPFTEVKAIYGPSMSGVLSGALAYEYFNYENDYGLINITDGDVNPSEEYYNLQHQFSSATPSSTSSAQYTPYVAAPSTCGQPSPSAKFYASPTLPPLPYQLLCDCLMDTLECTVLATEERSYTVTPADIADYCQDYPDSCTGIRTNYTRGTYSAYSMCSLSEQLNIHINSLYVSSNRASDVCDNNGGTVKVPQQSNETCNGLLRQAKSDGTGTITSYPVGTTPTPVEEEASRNGGPSTSTDNKDGLSTGAKTSIGIGVAVGVIVPVLLAIAAFLFWRRHKKAKAAKDAKKGDYDGKPELPATEVQDGERAGFLPTMVDSKHKEPDAELSATMNQPAELPDPSWIPPEMAADPEHGGEPRRQR